MMVPFDDAGLSSTADEAESENEDENEDNGRLFRRRVDGGTTICVAGAGAKAWQQPR